MKSQYKLFNMYIKEYRQQVLESECARKTDSIWIYYLKCYTYCRLFILRQVADAIVSFTTFILYQRCELFYYYMDVVRTLSPLRMILLSSTFFTKTFFKINQLANNIFISKNISPYHTNTSS